MLWQRRCDFLDQAMLHEAIGETYRYHEREKHDPASAKKTYLLTEWRFVRDNGSADPAAAQKYGAGLDRIAAGRTTSAEEIAHEEILARKYRRAARYPWLPVGPDPPEPE